MFCHLLHKLWLSPEKYEEKWAREQQIRKVEREKRRIGGQYISYSAPVSHKVYIPHMGGFY